ncbi:Siphovirus Gp157 [Serratia marcescens]|uniref:siphovirus Gp157 family protein n=1 Tax=Serratia marcescens TaxID=615 RepID=UPI002179FBB7|nr:siphovirus Gp157 family protein [Serratia marcescens]CAI0871435.1 Siphovirus Gp157 [Serratia marcescens]CAI0979808.1 Siphovirus Gp157 [Serratia marcescens]
MSTRTIDLAIEMKKLQALAEDGELTPEMIKDTLEGLEGMVGDKLDATMAVVRGFEGQASVCDAESKRLAARKKSWDNQAGLLRKYILECLLTSGSDTIKTDLNTFTARKGSPSLVIDDEELLPDDYVESFTEVVNRVKKDELKKAILAGKEIKGAHIETGPRSLQVR